MESISIQSSPGAETLTAVEIENLIVNFIATNLEVDPAGIETDVTFDRLGVDSVVAVKIVMELETKLGREIDPTAAYDYPTIETLAQYLGSPT